jgi:hypothetical protein
MGFKYTILFIIMAAKLAVAENKCKVKMSNSKMSVFKTNDELIYNEGVLNTNWADNSMTPYVVTSDVDMEYFYIIDSRVLVNAATHEAIVMRFLKLLENIIKRKRCISSRAEIYP